MELLPVSNTSQFFTWTANNHTFFTRFLDDGDVLHIDNSMNIIEQVNGIQHYIIHAGIFGAENANNEPQILDGIIDYSRAIDYESMPLEIFEDSDSTTLVLSLQVVSSGIDIAGTQETFSKPDSKFSRYIMPIEIPENSGIMLGNTDVTMEEGTWYEYPIEKSQRVYNNNNDDEELIILYHDIVKTKQANTSVIKLYLENFNGAGLLNSNSNRYFKKAIELIDSQELKDNYQRQMVRHDDWIIK